MKVYPFSRPSGTFLVICTVYPAINGWAKFATPLRGDTIKHYRKTNEHFTDKKILSVATKHYRTPQKIPPPLRIPGVEG